MPQSRGIYLATPQLVNLPFQFDYYYRSRRGERRGTGKEAVERGPSRNVTGLAKKLIVHRCRRDSERQEHGIGKRRGREREQDE